MDILKIRERDAGDIAAYQSGETDDHPHGASGKRWIIPKHESKQCWDTSPEAYAFSEMGEYS